MRNLKRLLTMTLALAFMMSLMAVGAGAAFKDEKDIAEKNREAVDTMVALNIINGRDNGNFDPNGIVTRAEMCKMIAIALNGGKVPVLGTSLTPTYKDVKGHWAEAFIEYCTNLGIVAGVGDGMFAPDKTVTPTQAAKMLLVALGYDSKVEKFTGSAWAINVNVRANQKGLYDKMTVDPNEGLNRTYAAQMIYNTLSADVVAIKADGTYDTKQVTNSVGSTVKTGTETWYRFTDIVGGRNLAILNGNEFKTYADAQQAALGVDAAAVPTDYTLTAVNHDVYGAVTVTETVTQSFGNKHMNLSTFKGVVNAVGHVDNKGYTVTVGATTFTEIKDDPSKFVGQKVNLLYKATDDVYGLFSNKDTTIALNTSIAALSRSSLTGDTNNLFEVSSVEYKSEEANASNIPVYDATGDYIGTMASAVLATASAGSDLKLVDNNGNGKIDLAVMKKAEVYKVNYVSSTEVTLIAADNANSTLRANVGTYKLADIIAPTGLAKDDYVVFNVAGDNAKSKVELKKAEVKTFAVKGTKSASGYNQAMFDGNWYKLMPLQDQTTDFNYDNKISFVDVNGVIYAAKVGDAAFNGKYLVLKGLNTTYNQVEAKVMFSDGTTKVIDLDKATKDNNTFYSIKNSGVNYYADVDTTDGANYVVGTDMLLATDTLYGYSLTSDNKYRLIDTAKVTNYSAVLGVKGYGTSNLNNKTFGSVNIDDNAVVMVKDTADNNNYYVTTGKAVKAWGSSAVTTAAQYVYSNTNGYSYVKAAFVTVNATYSSSDAFYAYVTDMYTTTVNDKAGQQVKLFDGTTTIDAFVANADITGSAAKGDIVEFTKINETSVKIKQTYKLGTSGVAITGYDEGAKKVTFNTMGLNVNGSTAAASDKAYELVSETKILYIDSKNTEGKGSGSISIANKDADNNLIGDMNALYVMRGSSNSGDSNLLDLGLIVVDVANKLDGITGTTMNSFATTAAINGCNVTITPNTTKAVVGQKVTYTVNVTATTATTGTITVALPNLTGATTLVETADVGNQTTVAGLVITLTNGAATNSTFTVTGTVTATAVTPSVS